VWPGWRSLGDRQPGGWIRPDAICIRTAMDKRQQTFDFHDGDTAEPEIQAFAQLSEAERFAALDSVGPERYPQLTANRAHWLRELIRIVWKQTSGRGPMAGVVTYARHATIARKLQRSPRSVRRAVADGRRLGLLRVEQVYDRQRDLVLTRTVISWRTLAAKLAAPEGKLAAGAAKLAAPIDRNESLYNPSQPSTKPTGDTAAGGDTAEQLERVGGDLQDRGAGAPRKIIADALAAGLTLEDVAHFLEILDANPDKLRGIGAISFRIRSGRWPAEDLVDPRAIRKRKAARAKRLRSERTERAARQDLLAQERQRAERLESAYGSMLDAMSQQELEQLAASAFGSDQFAWERWRRRPESMRGELLEKLEEVAGQLAK